MSKKSILTVFLIYLIPSVVFAGEYGIETGYDVYHNIQLMDSMQSTEEITAVLYTTGYLAGYLDGLILMQDVQYDVMFPKKLLSEKEREKLAKEMRFHRINIPKGGLHAGQLILIFKKYAEEHPEQLNESARSCIWVSLVDSYGWK